MAWAWTTSTAAAAARGIRVVNVPDYCIDEVADHAIGLDPVAPHPGHRRPRSGRPCRGTGISARAASCAARKRLRLGLVGLGRIGTAVARRALSFGYQVVGSDPLDREVPGVVVTSLEELLETSDVVSIHAGLDATTHHLIDKM